MDAKVYDIFTGQDITEDACQKVESEDKIIAEILEVGTIPGVTSVENDVVMAQMLLKIGKQLRRP